MLCSKLHGIIVLRLRLFSSASRSLNPKPLLSRAQDAHREAKELEVLRVEGLGSRLSVQGFSRYIETSAPPAESTTNFVRERSEHDGFREEGLGFQLTF